ncbi:hypothetical protein PUR59_27475 [Streptomyces sp. SP18ES09]|uniref:hypothetical protein n=1 Tax=Streptomyces sp. SP18ES09 TaxID=3002532 RepID=UPI002E7693CC|nr:hypothetical protein [Streptomyces sp. SP18ES09]MEE1818747.1 hypothetical protein [Streptomyces sp. SP18ES09]
MALCAECEQAGSGHPAREPVLVGEVLDDIPVLLALWRSHEPRSHEPRSPEQRSHERRSHERASHERRTA